MIILNRIFDSFFKHCVLVLLIFVSIFILQRATLVLLNLQYFADVPTLVIIKSFFIALRFDVRSALYLLLAYYVVAYILYFFKLERAGRTFAKYYLSFSAYILILLGIIEFYYFDYFHIRLNAYTLNTFENPAFVLKMVWESYPIIPLVLFSAIVLFSLLYIFRKLSSKFLIDYTTKKFPFQLVGFIFIILLSIIGLRGTLEIKTPLRWGHAFFSEYTRANQLALNYVFTLVDDVSHKTDNLNYKKHLSIKDVEKAKLIAEPLIKDSSSLSINFPLRRYNYHDSSQQKYNVVLLLLESFSQAKIATHLSQGYDLFINRLSKQSINFQNCYSNGFHTYMGLFSSISGMPNSHIGNVMKRTEGRQKFTSLPHILKRNGYRTYFGVSHVPNFDNMGGFMSINGTDKIISELNFDESESLSSLGVPDHRLFEKMNQELSQSEKPFFATILSTNNHGPWIIPEVKNKQFDDTFLYTDWALEHFFELASKEKYFENTIFVITADHGIPQDAIYDFDLSATHVPLVIYAPKLLKHVDRQNITSHIDIPEIILGALKISHNTTSFSHDILSFDNNNRGYALFQEGGKLGFIYNNWYLIDRLGSNSSLYKYQSEYNKIDYANDSTQVLQDLKRKMHALYLLGNDMIDNMKSSEEIYLK